MKVFTILAVLIIYIQMAWSTNKNQEELVEMSKYAPLTINISNNSAMNEPVYRSTVAPANPAESSKEKKGCLRRTENGVWFLSGVLITIIVLGCIFVYWAGDFDFSRYNSLPRQNNSIQERAMDAVSTTIMPNNSTMSDDFEVFNISTTTNGTETDVVPSTLQPMDASTTSIAARNTPRVSCEKDLYPSNRTPTRLYKPCRSHGFNIPSTTSTTTTTTTTPPPTTSTTTTTTTPPPPTTSTTTTTTTPPPTTTSTTTTTTTTTPPPTTTSTTTTTTPPPTTTSTTTMMTIPIDIDVLDDNSIYSYTTANNSELDTFFSTTGTTTTTEEASLLNKFINKLNDLPGPKAVRKIGSALIDMTPFKKRYVYSDDFFERDQEMYKNNTLNHG
ncbi:hypothetical protein NECID01_0284 [Nematocida sp. AWRm77]|nr:hypothetical protein NECID01_0284 [Nematocida sp. AWRm77]